MTEAEWLASSNPPGLLDWLQLNRDRPARRISGRKLRLFACACCRQVWYLLADPRSRQAVEAGERYADGEATTAELAAARAAARDAAWATTWDADCAAAMDAAWATASATASAAAWDAARAVARAAAWDAARDAASDAASAAARSSQADLLREIVGNPFRPVTLPVCDRCGGDYGMRWVDNPDTGVCPACIGGRQWRTPTVLSLAQAAYEERPGRKCGRCGGEGGGVYGLEEAAWECEPCHGTGRIEDGTLDPVRLSILADALEEAGCEGEAQWHPQTGVLRTTHPLLAHLRSSGPHVRGCWAVDCVLGKE